jgi:hypothetical protein
MRVMAHGLAVIPGTAACAMPQAALAFDIASTA